MKRTLVAEKQVDAKEKKIQLEIIEEQLRYL